jgi:MFS family permease
MDTGERDVRARFSWLWVFVMLNMIYADIFSFMIAGNLKQLMTGQAGQITITPEFLLLAAVLTQVPLAMVVLSQVLPRRATRWANMVAAVFTILYVVGLGSATPHYVFIAGLEVVACLSILWFAWRWRAEDERVAVRGRGLTTEQANG